MNTKTFELADLNATERLAHQIAAELTVPITITLNGTLGAGKTQWVRYIADAMGVPPEEVTSPTYVLLQRYVGRQKIYHFDFYRLDTADQVWDLGIDEIFLEPAVVLIEWANKFPECLPDDYLQLEISTHPDDQNGERRTVRATANGSRLRKLLQRISE